MSRRHSGFLFLFYYVDQIIATKNRSKNDTISSSLQPNILDPGWGMGGRPSPAARLACHHLVKSSQPNKK